VNENVTIANEKMVFLKRTSKVGLHFPRLDYDSLQLACYTDGSFANRADKSNQIGFVSCLLDKNGAMCITSFRSCTSMETMPQCNGIGDVGFCRGF
jgi:adenylylsulfate kinase-like enzyme